MTVHVYKKAAPRPFVEGRDLDLGKHLVPRITPLPSSFTRKPIARDTIGGVPWGMMLNDQLGDCTCAGVGHTIQLTSAVSVGSPVTLTDLEVERLYEQVGGYRPGQPNTDNGCVEADVLDFWASHGVNGHKLDAHGSIDVADLGAIKSAIQLFGSVYIGLQVPELWDSGPNTWGMPRTKAQAQIVGGHCVILVGWNSTGFTLVSWGRTYLITYAAFKKYCDEVHGVIPADWLKGAVDVDGLDLATLKADLAQLDGGKSEPSTGQIHLEHWQAFEDAASEYVDELEAAAGKVEAWAQGEVAKIKPGFWRTTAASFVSGLGGAVAAVGVAITNHANATDTIESAVAAFVLVSIAKHLPGANSVTAAELIALEQRILAAIAGVLAKAE